MCYFKFNLKQRHGNYSLLKRKSVNNLVVKSMIKSLFKTLFFWSVINIIYLLFHNSLLILVEYCGHFQERGSSIYLKKVIALTSQTSKSADTTIIPACHRNYSF